MLYVRLTLPQIVKTSCLKSHLWKIWLQFVIGAAYEIALWESNGENNKLTLCSSLSELHLTKLKQIQLKKKNPMSCSLKCFQVYGLKLNSFFFTKRDPLFPSFPPPYPLFFSSSKVQRISELITVFHQLFDLGMVTFSKHLLHPFPILLHFFFNLSSIFPITS